MLCRKACPCAAKILFEAIVFKLLQRCLRAVSKDKLQEIIDCVAYVSRSLMRSRRYISSWPYTTPACGAQACSYICKRQFDDCTAARGGSVVPIVQRSRGADGRHVGTDL